VRTLFDYRIIPNNIQKNEAWPTGTLSSYFFSDSSVRPEYTTLLELKMRVLNQECSQSRVPPKP
jgi:hypothetical protein